LFDFAVEFRHNNKKWSNAMFDWPDNMNENPIFPPDETLLAQNEIINREERARKKKKEKVQQEYPRILARLERTVKSGINTHIRAQCLVAMDFASKNYNIIGIDEAIELGLLAQGYLKDCPAKA
jgi:hypothetical protein